MSVLSVWQPSFEQYDCSLACRAMLNFLRVPSFNYASRAANGSGAQKQRRHAVSTILKLSFKSYDNDPSRQCSTPALRYMGVPPPAQALHMWSTNRSQCSIDEAHLTLRQLQPSPQATPHVLDTLPTGAIVDAPAPEIQPFWHTHRTWEDACKPLHAFSNVQVCQCGMIPVHTSVSH